MTLESIDVRDLVGHPGASREAAIQGTVDGLSTELASVPDDTPVRGQFLLESVVEGILVSGRLEGMLSLRCARCLAEFTQPFSVELTEMFVEHPEEDSDEYPLDPEAGIDPDQMVRDAVGVEMPFSPLCRPDCRGLCEVCGGNRNLGECPGHPDTSSPFAVLAGMFPEETEETREGR